MCSMNLDVTGLSVSDGTISNFFLCFSVTGIFYNVFSSVINITDPRKEQILLEAL